MGRFLVGDRARPLDLGSGRDQLSLEQDSVRLVDLSRFQLLARRAQLAARHDDGGPRPPGDLHLGKARCGQRGEVARLQARACLDDGLARADVSSGRAHVCAPLDRLLDFDRVVILDNILEGDDGIGSLRYEAAGCNAHRLTGLERRGAGAPAAIRWTTGSRPGVSDDRSAKPSIAELSNGGRSTVVAASSASTLPAAVSRSRVSAGKRSTRSSTRRRASSIEIRFLVAAKAPISYFRMSETIAGRYRLEQQLGAGSMAEVWLATDTQLGRPVALKLLRADADPQRFDREARAVASLSHPNICRLYDYGSEGGRPFMVFEHLPGGTLEERLGQGGPLPDAETRKIATEVAAGLAHAHGHGLVHRDLKPANILFDEEGRAKVSDFGIARMSGVDTLTEAGTLIGTATYMSPEQASGEGATPASDVYSFGVILYRILTGRLPFESTNAVDLVRRQLHELPPPVSAFRPDAPHDLAAIAEESLAKEPAERPPDGSALVGLLTGATAATLGGAATQVMPAAGTQVIAQPEDRRWSPWAIGLIAWLCSSSSVRPWRSSPRRAIRTRLFPPPRR